MDSADRDRAFQLANGFRATQMVRAVAELRIPDLVAAGPTSCDDLAASTGLQPGSLRRVLRGLVSLGVFTETEDGRFGPTPVSECFRDRPGTLRGMALMLPSESYVAFGDLMHSLRTEQPAFEHVFGMTRWEALAQEPEQSSIFNAAMQATTERIKDALLAAYDFGGLHTVVDVGGGRGSVIAAMLKAYPHMRGTLLDLPAGLAESEAYLREQGVLDRCQIMSGDFFESVPAGCDAYVLKQIVHDWSDEKATAILATCRRAMGAGARLILIERILPDRAEDSAVARAAFMSDIQMMVMLGGRERRVEGFRALMRAAGLRLSRVIPTESEFKLIEGVPL